ncbi:hypothetical protein NE865_01989 [Phthorimaea operculella]|nr:hypothetical protein NE865_01989 [Phthorimaea operculella]
MTALCSGLLVCLLVVVCCNANPVSQLKKCKLSDANCMKESSQAYLNTFLAGFPEIGVRRLEPIMIDKMDVSDAGLKLILTNGTTSGLDTCRVKKMSYDTQKNRLTGKAQCDLRLDGTYEMSGQLLILPIVGNGPVHVKLRKIVLNIDADMEEIVTDGKTYWNIKSWTHTFTLKEKAYVEFGNLYPDNQLLGDAARDVISQNSNEIIYSIGAPVVKGVLKIVLNTLNKFFNSVPNADLIDIQ